MVDPTSPSICSNEEPAPNRRVALAHDWIVARRGGELVLAEIARAIAEQPDLDPVGLYTMFHNGTAISPEVDALTVRTSTLDGLPGSLRRWLLPAYPHAARNLSNALAHDHAQKPVDLLISTSSVAAKAIRPPQGVPHLCYCHTPARYLWSQADAYATGGIKGALRGAGLGLFRRRLQAWDRATSVHVTRFLANSTHTQALIRDVYGRDADVLHPPVRTDYFTPDPTVRRGDFLLVVSALEPYKRVDLAIDIAASAGRPLVIVGNGSHARALREHAAATTHAEVRFVTDADDAAVRDHYRRAFAFLMPQTEDFGITAVEAQSCGCPVVALALGGALDSVVPGETGVLIPHDAGEDAGTWAESLSNIPPESADLCRLNAERFSPGRFRAGLLAHADDLNGS